MSELTPRFSGPIQTGVSANGGVYIRVAGDNSSPETPADLSAIAVLIGELESANIEHRVMCRKDPQGNRIPDAVEISTLSTSK